MTTAQQSKPMNVFSDDLHTFDTDLLVIPVFEGAIGDEHPWSRATGGELERAGASKEFAGKLYEMFWTPMTDRSYRAPRLAAIGLGRVVDFTADRARRAFRGNDDQAGVLRRRESGAGESAATRTIASSA